MIYKCKYMCFKWINGLNECSKFVIDKMYIQCKVKVFYIFFVQYVIKIIENIVQLFIFILKLIVGKKKFYVDVYLLNV